MRRRRHSRRVMIDPLIRLFPVCGQKIRPGAPLFTRGPRLCDLMSRKGLD